MRSDRRPATGAGHRDRQRRFWNGWHAQVGEFQRLDLLGTGLVQGDPAVTVRLRFTRGGPTLQLIWGPRRLGGFRIVPADMAVPLAAESPGSWVYFRYRGPLLVRLTFAEDGTLKIERRVEP